MAHRSSLSRLATISVLVLSVSGLAGCGTAAVVGATYGVTKAAVKTTVGTAKLAGRGVVAAGRGMAAAGRAVIPSGNDAGVDDSLMTGSIERPAEAPAAGHVPVPSSRY